MKDKGYGTELNLFNIPTMSGNYYETIEEGCYKGGLTEHR